MYHRPTTAYLERAMHTHYAKACDMTLSSEVREINRMIGAQLEAVVKLDAKRANWHGIKHRAAT